MGWRRKITLDNFASAIVPASAHLILCHFSRGERRGAPGTHSCSNMESSVIIPYMNGSRAL
eukprot:3825527-Pyramimonas_sp.AAC.1